MKKLFFLMTAILLSWGGFAQPLDLPCDNLDYKESVRTVLLYADGNQNKEPLISLEHMIGRLTLSFDLLGNEGEVLNYTFIHCTHDWYPTDIQRLHYATGFESERIDDFQFSRNTLVDYVHYQLSFPEEDMLPVIPGNYLLIVYGDQLAEEDIYFTRRFMVLDEKAFIDASVPRYCDDLSLSDTHQQLNIKVSMPSIMTGNVQQYASMTIRQNGRWDNAVVGLKPSFVYPDFISYEHLPQTVFEGANQYRRVNFSNFYFQSENIAHIYQTDDYYVIDYAVCESRARKPYITYEDLHGEKYIYVSNEGLEADTEADYAWLNLFLRWPNPLTNEDVYVMGAINDWRFDDRNLMRYDYQLGGYLCQLLLKQGYYNFMFVTADRETGQVATDLTAGNHWDTDNLYRIYFYYYIPNKGYDALIGYTTCPSH
ncbi:MAG: DUF5103 domain-containing protein [Bacteroidales bacterium]|nr:DUF5103 domain-containing protein [Bacteroidales bacterium]